MKITNSIKTGYNIAIFANGRLSDKFIHDASNYDYLIATDIASLKLIKAGFIPDLAIGDFDSVSANDFRMLKNKISNVRVFPAEKNFTDLDLAVKEAIRLTPLSIDMYGVTGSRLDHFLAAINLLDVIENAGIKGIIIDDNNQLFIVHKKAVLEKDENLPYLSLIPFSGNALVSVKGVRFKLNRKQIEHSQTLAISNEITEKLCQITVHQGKIFVVRSKD